MSKARLLAQLVSQGSNLADAAITASEVSGLSAVATSGAYSDLSGKPTLSAVAASGAYSDLSGKPDINALLPSQTGNAAKLLSTNGTTPGWVDAPKGFTNGKALFFSN